MAFYKYLPLLKASPAAERDYTSLNKVYLIQILGNAAVFYKCNMTHPLTWLE